MAVIFAQVGGGLSTMGRQTLSPDVKVIIQQRKGLVQVLCSVLLTQVLHYFTCPHTGEERIAVILAQVGGGRCAMGRQTRSADVKVVIQQPKGLVKVLCSVLW